MNDAARTALGLPRAAFGIGHAGTVAAALRARERGRARVGSGPGGGPKPYPASLAQSARSSAPSANGWTSTRKPAAVRVQRRDITQAVNGSSA